MRVYPAPNGDLYFKCEFCDHTDKLPKTAQASPFWEMYVGNIVLVLVQHEVDRHDVNPRTRAETQPIQFDTGPQRGTHRK